MSDPLNYARTFGHGNTLWLTIMMFGLTYIYTFVWDINWFELDTLSVSAAFVSRLSRLINYCLNYRIWRKCFVSIRTSNLWIHIESVIRFWTCTFMTIPSLKMIDVLFVLLTRPLGLWLWDCVKTPSDKL